MKILIVEDEPLIAEDISDCLTEAGFKVCGTAYSGEEAFEALESCDPDAVLLDIDLGDGPNGFAVAELVNEKHNIPIVFLTSHSDRGTLEKVKEVRPAGYLVKPFREAELLTALEIAVMNHVREKSVELTLDAANAILPNPLSEREFEVLVLLKEGLTNKEIGERLFLSVNTVKSHLLHLYEKLDVRNRTEALFRIGEMTS